MNKFLLFIALSFGTFILIFSSSINVYDASNGKKIEFVIVASDKSEKQVMTPFEAEENSTLTIRCVGYKEKTIEVTNSEVNVFLEIEAVLISESIIFSDAVYNVIKKADVSSDINSAIKDLSPFVQIRLYNRSATFSLSGMSQEHILFSIDQVPMVNQMSRIFDMDLISPAMVKSIAVSKNSASALKGENLFGGIIDIETHKQNGLTVIGTAASNSCGFSVDMKEGILSGGFFIYSYGDMVLPGQAVLENSDKNSFGFNVKAKTNKTDISILMSSSEAGDPGISGYRYLDSRMKNTLTLMSHSSCLNENMKLTNSFTGTSYLYHNDEIIPASEDTSVFTSLLSSFVFYKSGGSFSFSNQLNKAIGTKIKNSEEVFPSISLSLKKMRIFTDITAGVSFTEKAQFIYSFTSMTNFSFMEYEATAGIKTSVRRPTFNELYWRGDAFAKGNENLESERLTGVFASVDKDFPHIKIKNEFGFNYYSSLIKWVNEDGLYTPKNISYAANPYVSNIIKFKSEYVEIENVLNLSPNITDDFKIVPYSPVFTENFSFKANYKKLFFVCSADYQSDIFISLANTKKLDRSFFLKEVSAGFLLNSTTFSLCISNPLDMNIESVNGYYLEGRNIKILIKAVI